FTFVAGQRPQPNAKGRTPTTMEWARKITEQDVKVLRGEAPYSEKGPDPDQGFTQADPKGTGRAPALYKGNRARPEKARQERPLGYLAREAPAEDVRALRILLGHLRAGLFVTKFRKVFTRGEMADDLYPVAARLGGAQDESEYEEVLPVSPP